MGSAYSWADAPADVPRFAIRQFLIEGNVHLSSDALTAAVGAYIGDNGDFSVIQKAVNAVLNAYKTAGYETVRVVIPRQEIDNGVVHLQVIEARLGRVWVQGNQFFDTANILRALPALHEGEIPSIRDLGIVLRLSNENYAKQAQVTFRQGEDPHTVDAVVAVADARPWHAVVSLDNTGNEQTGNWRLGFAYMQGNVFNRDHMLSAQFVTSPDHWNDVRIFGLNYRIPLYGLGGALELSAGSSSVDSGVVNTTAGSYGISGSGDNLGIHYDYLLPRIREWDQRLTAGFDDLFFHNSVTLQGFSSGSLVPDTEVHDLNLAYSGFIRQPEREWGLRVGLHHNIPGGQDGNDRAFRAARQSADAHYTLLRYDAHLTQQLPANWQAHVQLNGQLTSDALISGEQFGIGGASSVRGFEERALSNDKGHRVSLELHTPDFGNLINGAGLKLHALAFVDTANANRNFALPGEAMRQHLTSAGPGLRGSLGQHAQLELDVADVLDDGGLAGSSKKYAQSRFIYVF